VGSVVLRRGDARVLGNPNWIVDLAADPIRLEHWVETNLPKFRMERLRVHDDKSMKPIK
jgi:hypothetical protein